MNTESEKHAIRFNPSGFFGLGKSMKESKQGDFVKFSEYETLALSNHQLEFRVRTIKVREDFLDTKVAKLCGEVDVLRAALEKSRSQLNEANERCSRFEGIQKTVLEMEKAVESILKFVPKTGTNAKAAKAAIALYRKSIKI